MPNGFSGVLFLLGCNSLSFETTLGSLPSLGCSVTYWLQWQDQTSWLLQQNLESAGSVITNRTKSSARVTQLSWIGRVPQQPQKAHLIPQCMFLLLPPLNKLISFFLISFFFVCLVGWFVFCLFVSSCFCFLQDQVSDQQAGKQHGCPFGQQGVLQQPGTGNHKF